MLSLANLLLQDIPRSKGQLTLRPVQNLQKSGHVRTLLGASQKVAFLCQWLSELKPGMQTASRRKAALLAVSQHSCPWPWQKYSMLIHAAILGSLAA